MWNANQVFKNTGSISEAGSRVKIVFIINVTSSNLKLNLTNDTKKTLVLIILNSFSKYGHGFVSNTTYFFFLKDTKHHTSYWVLETLCPYIEII